MKVGMGFTIATHATEVLDLRVCWPAREPRTGKSPKVLPESALESTLIFESTLESTLGALSEISLFSAP